MLISFYFWLDSIRSWKSKVYNLDDIIKGRTFWNIVNKRISKLSILSQMQWCSLIESLCFFLIDLFSILKNVFFFFVSRFLLVDILINAGYAMYNCYLYSILRSRSRDVHGDERGQLYQRRRHFGKLSWQTIWTILIFVNSLTQIYFLDILFLKVETTALINFCVQRLTLTFPIKE